MKEKIILNLLVFIGGGLGALTRYILTLFTDGYLKDLSPSMTIAFLHTADILSAILIGIFIFMCEHYEITNAKILALIKTGFLGGLSSFSILTIIYADTQNYALSFLAIVLEITIFIIITIISYYLIKSIYNLKKNYISK